MAIPFDTFRVSARRKMRDFAALLLRIAVRKPWHFFFGSLACLYVLVLLGLAGSSRELEPVQPPFAMPTTVSAAPPTARAPTASARPVLATYSPRSVPTTVSAAAPPLPLSAEYIPVEEEVPSAPIPVNPPASNAPKQATLVTPDVPAPVRRDRGVPASFIWPARETFITSAFGNRMDPIWISGTQRHRGLDIRSTCGTPIVAAAAGEVIFAQLTRGSGNTVRILHPGGMLTRYAHLSRLDVRPGEQVRAGQRIGLSGATGRTTGPHLHFEIWRNSKPENPLRYKFKYLPAAAFAGGDPFIDCYSRNSYRAPTEPEPLHEPGEMEWPGEDETSNLLQEYDRFIHSY